MGPGRVGAGSGAAVIGPSWADAAGPPAPATSSPANNSRFRRCTRGICLSSMSQSSITGRWSVVREQRSRTGGEQAAGDPLNPRIRPGR